MHISKQQFSRVAFPEQLLFDTFSGTTNYQNMEENMPLQQLVQYFNDRFETGHHSNMRPFILEKRLVSGIFGPITL